MIILVKVTWGSESKSNNYKIFDELKLENSDLMDLDNEIDIQPNNLESIKKYLQRSKGQLRT